MNTFLYMVYLYLIMVVWWSSKFTSQKEETKNNNRRKKDLHCLQLANRLASQKDWRTAQTIIRG
jgi:hypothetical protein